MVEPTARTGLAYGVVKTVVATQPPNSWKKLNGALEGIMPSYKDLGIPEAAAFVAIHIRAGVQMVRIDSGKHGPAMAEKMTALEAQDANFIIRASVPGVSNETAAGCLNDVLNILYTGRDGGTAVLGVFHLDDAGVPVCNMSAQQ